MNKGNSVYTLRYKFWNLDQDDREYRKACIPRVLWKDMHSSWDRSHYWFKNKNDHIGRGQYFMQ